MSLADGTYENRVCNKAGKHRDQGVRVQDLNKRLSLNAAQTNQPVKM